MNMRAPPRRSSKKSAIPADFFQRLATRDVHAELSYSLNRQRLHAALMLPATHRWVAEWLFMDSHSPLHPNIRLPPDAFRNLLPMHVVHHFHDRTSAPQPSGHDSPVCPMSAHAKLHTKPADFLLLPVAAVDRIVVGYNFGTISGDMPSQTRGESFCGRFVFDTDREDLLIVTTGLQPSMSVSAGKVAILMSFRWNLEHTREHCMFMCPLQEYSYFNLPNEILFCSSAEMRLSRDRVPDDIIDPMHEFFEHHSVSDSTDIIGDMLQKPSPSDHSSIHDVSPFEDFLATSEHSSALSALPWFVDNSGTPLDNVGIPPRPGVMSSSSGAFDMDSLSASLSAIEASLHGDFYGIRNEEDTIHPKLQSAKAAHPLFSRRVVARVSRAEEYHASKMRDLARSIYLTHVTPVQLDERHLRVVKADDRLTKVLATPGFGARDSGNALISIAPLPVSSSNEETKKEESHQEEKEKKKEDKLESKRRRNRLSAARSNEKRRENWRMKQSTLVSLRKRVEELERRREALLFENHVLMEHITAGSK